VIESRHQMQTISATRSIRIIPIGFFHLSPEKNSFEKAVWSLLLRVWVYCYACYWTSKRLEEEYLSFDNSRLYETSKDDGHTGHICLATGGSHRN